MTIFFLLADAVIMKFEASGAANKLEIESLNSKLGELHLELRSKEDKIELLIVTQDKLEKEKSELQMSNDVLEKKLVISLQEVKDLEGFLHVSAGQLVELDKQSLTFMEKFYQLNSLYDSCHKLIQEERDLALKQAQGQYDQLHDRFLCITSEKDALRLVNQGLDNKIIELQKSHESVMVQLSEECQLAKEKIQRLETEAEALISKKIETESLVSKMEKEIDTLSESSRSSENKMVCKLFSLTYAVLSCHMIVLNIFSYVLQQDLLMKISSIEAENNCYTDKLQAEIQKKEVEIVNLQQESKKRDLHVDSLEKQVGQLQDMLEEKEQLLLQYRDGEKKLKDQITEVLKLFRAH